MNSTIGYEPLSLGLNPSTSTTDEGTWAASSIGPEHRTFNAGVPSSSLGRPTILSVSKVKGET
jgi:hypothetical protein